MTCKDCLHFDVCEMCNDFDECGDPVRYNVCERYECKDFANKSKWVHLPCNVGDRVFSIVIIGGEYTVVSDRVHALKISGEDIYVDTNWYESGEIEYNVFITQEEAEKALEERKEK